MVISEFRASIKVVSNLGEGFTLSYFPLVVYNFKRFFLRYNLILILIMI